MNYRLFIIFLFLLTTGLKSEENLIKKILEKEPNKFKSVIQNKDKYRLQIIYTQINRDSENIPKLVTHKFRVKNDEYFYPASIVKLPLSVFALEKINNLKKDGLTKDTILSIETNHSCQTPVKQELNKSIGEYIKRAFIVSDNDSYNRLYEFLGQNYIQKRFNQLNYTNTRIIHRFSYCDATQNKYTNPFTFYNDEGEIIYSQKGSYNKNEITKPIEDMCLGLKYVDGKGKTVKAPKDFFDKNFISLETIDEILKKIIFPDVFKASKRFILSKEDLNFLRKFLAIHPSESEYDEYKNNENIFDSLTNYFIYGRDKNSEINKNIKIFNIVGLSYGFAIDIAYIIDIENNIEFFLSAVIYTNNNNTINDGKYEYYTGFAFLKNLSLAVYNYELKRKRKHIPDLTEFKDLFIDNSLSYSDDYFE